jgi:hypothetical protein
VASDHSDAIGGAPLAVVRLFRAHALFDETCPLALPKVLEAPWPDDRQANNLGHRAVLAEEEPGTSGGDVSPKYGSLESSHAWPFFDGIDQIRGRWIRERVGHLVEDIVRFYEVNDRGWLGRPEVLETAEVGILATGEKPVEMLGEDWKIAGRVVDTGMVMVGHGDAECDLHLGAHGGQREAIDEGIVCVFVWAKKEAPLRTTARNHIITTGHNLARESHARDFGNAEKKLRNKMPLK